jgi:murein DD-endopeptidase
MYSFDQFSQNRIQKILSLKKILICILILLVVIFFKKFDTPISGIALNKIDYFVFKYTYDFKDIVSTIQKIPEKAQTISVLKQFKHIFIIPVNGEVSSGYGMRIHPVLKVERMHNGIDISQAEGTPVKAAMDGIVAYAGEDREMGRFVKMSHESDFVTIYAHLNEVHVKKGDKINQGAVIGTLGKTGLAESPHLHFEVWQHNIQQNPAKWLNLP